MKKYLFSPLGCLFGLMAHAQSSGVNFQSVLVDTNGITLSNESVGLKFSFFYSNNLSTIIYSETHSVTTNAKGLVTVVVGSGTKTSSGSDLLDLNWEEGITLKIERLVSGSYQTFGIQALEAVPVSFYAKKAGAVANLSIGTSNMAIGNGASYTSTVSNVTLVGASTSSSDNLRNATALGANATVTTSNTIQLGDSNVTLVQTSGTVSATKFVGDGSELTNLSPSSLDGLKIETSGNLNVAIGKDTFGSNSTGVSNVAIGERSMSVSNTTGSWNTAVGAATMIYNSIGSENTAIGSGAIEENTTGNSNTAVGHWALNGNKTGSFNTTIGWKALTATVSSSANTAIGSTALKNLTSGVMNIAIGSGSIEDAISGNHNVAVGGDALHQNSVGSYNIAIGTNALYSNTGSGTYDAGNGITWQNSNANVAVGMNTLYANTTGSFNTAIGGNAMENAATTINNVAVGIRALNGNVTGWDNTALGAYALMENTSYGEVAIGSHALRDNTSGSGNTAVGYFALYQNLTGSRNTVLGHQSGYNTNNGSGENTLIGYKADTVSGTTITNATAIGANATVTTSNTIQLGNSSVTNVYHYGTLGTASDKRLKENISQTKYGLNSLLRLNPVDYTLKASGNNQIGFIAQELMEIIPEAVSGKEGDLEKGEILSVSYSTLIPVLTKAIQQQQEQIEEQNTLIEALIKRIEALEKN